MDALVSSFGLDWKIFLAEIVNFTIVLGLIYWIVKSKVMPTLDKRQATIKGGVENAEKAEEVLAQAETDKDTIISDAEIQASETISASVQKGKDREADIVAEAGDKADSILSVAQAKGENEKEQIIASSKEEIAKMITLGAEKILAQK